MKKPSPKLQLLIGVVVSLAFFLFALSGIDFENLVSQLRNAELLVSSISTLALLAIAFWIKAVRWSLILRPLGQFSAASCLPAVCIGFMGNNIYPARLGEFLRAYAFARQTNVPFSAALSSLFVERLLDLIAILVYFYVAIALLGADGLPPHIHKGGLVLAVVSGTAICGLLPFIFAPIKSEDLAARIIRAIFPASLAEKLTSFLSNAMSGLAMLRSPKLLAMCFTLSLIHWLIYGAMMIVALHALDLTLSLPRALFLQAVTAIAVLIPAAPGNIGVIQYAFRITLEIFPPTSILSTTTVNSMTGASAEQLKVLVSEKVVAAAIFYNIMQHIPVTLAGLFSLRVLGVDVSDAQAQKLQQETVTTDSKADLKSDLITGDSKSNTAVEGSTPANSTEVDNNSQ